jgi:hypothetical protein
MNGLAPSYLIYILSKSRTSITVSQGMISIILDTDGFQISYIETVIDVRDLEIAARDLETTYRE